MAWFNCFIALNSFWPNLFAVSFVEGWWRECSMTFSQSKSEIWECCKRLLDRELVAASHIFILPVCVYIYITPKRFQAEFSTAADFLQTLGFPCVFAWDAGSGHFCSAGYLYRRELLRHERSHVLLPSFYRLLIWNRSDWQREMSWGTWAS